MKLQEGDKCVFMYEDELIECELMYLHEDDECIVYIDSENYKGDHYARLAVVNQHDLNIVNPIPNEELIKVFTCDEDYYDDSCCISKDDEYSEYYSSDENSDSYSGIYSGKYLFDGGYFADAVPSYYGD